MEKFRNMQKDSQRLCLAVGVAAVLWFYMFSPWTGGLSNFWLNMSISAAVLSTMALLWSGLRPVNPDPRKICLHLLAGIAIAFALWGIFYLGDKISQLIFPFARGEVDRVYGMKAGADASLTAILLLVLIGPSEEMFWRGYIQKRMAEIYGPTSAFVVTTLVYALVHIWSFNFMLVMAAFVAGAVWGLIYRLKPSLLPALVISHALWDALVFVILPI